MDKIAELSGMRFGVEIETIGISRKDTVSAILTVVGGEIGHEGGSYDKWHCIALDGRKWNAVSDASIGRGNAEIVSPILTYPDDISALQNVIRAIRKNGGKVNSSCGIHVHVDASCLNGRQLGNLAKIVYKQEPLILHALQISEARLNSYTKPMEPSFIENVDKYRPHSIGQLGKLWYKDNDDHHTEHYHSSRYHGVNFHSLFYRGTVEFRWFESTLHAGKVKSYIQYCLLLVNRAREVKFAASKKRCLSMESAKYDMRVHLLRIGAIGDEFKTMRKFLLENMPGCASYKHKPEQKVA
ncbi:amidoligase [Victivallaceae bacterium BBE-744-WT-12]|uniref:Amidoligase n=1 Tax=Victivallis lenta TaxID=2606640 RepID=A0A844G572_9BACT|nr:amidoligase family protein [Victivallis lenta]MST98506.1 amidoligase [Victivallis lenta]